MKDITFFISVGFIFNIPAISGFLYSIKSNEKGGKCYTNETHKAVAFIRNVTTAGHRGKSGVVEYAPMLPIVLDKLLNTMNCDLVHGKCESWKKKGFVLKSNVDESIFKNNYFPPVLDRRWNSIDEIITNGTFQYHNILDLGLKASGMLHFSILAKDSAQFIFFQDNQDNSSIHAGLLVVIDGFNGKNKANIRKCADIPNDGRSAIGCSELDEKRIKVLSDGTEWALITLKFNTRNSSSIGLEVLQGNKTTFSTIVKGKGNGQWRDPWKLAIRSFANYSVIFKMHKYNILWAEDAYAELQTNLKIGENRQKICLQVTYHYQDSHQPPIKVQIKNIALDEIAFESELTVNSSNYSWQTEEVVFKALAATEYNILVIVPKNVSIGAINFCSGKKDLVTTPDEVVEGHCQFVGEISGRGYESNITTNKLTFHEAEAFCDLHNDCEGVQICKNKGNCQCLSGFTYNYYAFQKCKLRCKDGFYGFDCKYKTEGAQCYGGNNINIHTGFCLDGCIPHYRSPKCTGKILQFQVAPHVHDLRAYSANISLTNAMQQLKSSDGFKHFHAADIQLRKRSTESFELSDWTTVASIGLDADLDNIELKMLTPNVEYKVRAVIREKDNQTRLDEVLAFAFQTPPCTPIDFNNTNVTVNLDLKLEVVLLVNDVNLCHIRSVEIKTLDGKIIYLKQAEVRVGKKFYQLEVPEDTKAEVLPYQITIHGDNGEITTFNYVYTPDAGINIYLIIIIVIAVITTIAIASVVTYILCKRKHRANKSILRHEQVQDNLTDDDTVALDLVPLPERPVTVLGEQSKKNSLIVKVAELERYIDKALKSNLLKDQHEQFPRGQTMPWVAGGNPENKKKNRYGNLAAYDATRVVLEQLPNDANSDYINANYIDGYKRPKAYIATQGPKPQTVNDFWRMIWQEKVSLIVMVANVIENGKAKCEKYWPDVQQTESFGTFSVKNAREEIFSDFIIRELWLHSNDGGKRMIQHMHFSTWPDHSVPLHPLSIVSFVRRISEVTSEAPVTVHCSAGVGRTGTIIMIDACLRMAKAEGCVDALAILAKMRSQRANMVDNHKQYAFVHLVLLEYLMVPQFSFPCNNLRTELESLMENDKHRLSQQFSKVNTICDKEWSRNQEESIIEKDKCRYPDILASEAHLVKLYPYGSNDSMSFVNAVYVDGFRRKNQFIATQLPMANTVESFWRMIEQNKVEQVVVLQETGDDQVKYLPKLGESLEFGDLEVITERQYEIKNSQVFTYFISMNGVQKSAVNVVCFSGWKVNDIIGPGVETLINLWEETERDRATGVSAIVCNDGASACGLFLGIGFVLEKIKLEQQVDVALATRILRHARPKFVCSQVQYEMLYTAAVTYLQMFETYGNFL